jgi:hypothetical protein
MSQSRLDLVKTLEGSGLVLIDGRETPIKYTIRIFQEMLDLGAGREVPGLQSAAGQLSELKPAEVAKLVGQKVRLSLDGEQKAEVIVTDLTGAFQVSGPIT